MEGTRPVTLIEPNGTRHEGFWATRQDRGGRETIQAETQVGLWAIRWRVRQIGLRGSGSHLVYRRRSFATARCRIAQGCRPAVVGCFHGREAVDARKKGKRGRAYHERDPERKSQMLSQSITKPTLEKLHKSGVHFVLCRAKDEGDRQAKTRRSGDRAGRNGRLPLRLCYRTPRGWRVASVSFRGGRACLVVDIDTFPNGKTKDATGLVERLGVTPLAIVNTRRGIHIYLRKDGAEIGKPGLGAGRLRGRYSEPTTAMSSAGSWSKLSGALDRLPDGSRGYSRLIVPEGRRKTTTPTDEGLHRGQSEATTLNAHRLCRLTLRGETDHSSTSTREGD